MVRPSPVASLIGPLVAWSFGTPRAKRNTPTQPDVHRFSCPVARIVKRCRDASIPRNADPRPDSALILSMG